MLALPLTQFSDKKSPIFDFTEIRNDQRLEQNIFYARHVQCDIIKQFAAFGRHFMPFSTKKKR